MKSSIEVIEEQASDDSVPVEEYLRRKANLAILTDDEGRIVDGQDYLVVEVDQAEHVKVVDSHASYPQAKLSVQGPGGELRKGRIKTSDYLIITCADNVVAEEVPRVVEPVVSDQIISPDIIPERIQTQKSSLPRRGMIWSSNRRRL